MNMINLMNEMLEAADFGDKPYAFVHRDTEHGKVKLYAQMVNTNSKNCIQKRWYLNDKQIAAKKLEAL